MVSKKFFCSCLSLNECQILIYGTFTRRIDVVACGGLCSLSRGHTQVTIVVVGYINNKFTAVSILAIATLE